MAFNSNCLRIVNAMPQRDQDALLARLDELQAGGMSPKKAQLQAAMDVLARVQRKPEIRKSADRIINTPAFKRWFGDSQVVDADGRPLVVYHGGRAGLTEFNNPDGYYKTGIFFTDDQDVAKAFGKGGETYDAYLSIQRPFVVDAEGAPYSSISRPAEMDDFAVTDTVDTDLIAEWAFKNGYDGVIVRNVMEGRGSKESAVYIASRNTQIKSATGNSGQFDPANPDIRKSNARPYMEDDKRTRLMFRLADEAYATPEAKRLQKEIDDTRERAAIRFQQVHAESIRLFNEKQRKNADSLRQSMGDEEYEGFVARVAMDLFGDEAQKKFPRVDARPIEIALRQYVENYIDERLPPRSPYADSTNQRREVVNEVAFKRWFGKSKAVDKDGNPLVALHGTTKDFSEFAVGTNREGRTKGAGVNPNFGGALGSWFAAPSLYQDNYDEGNAEAVADTFNGTFVDESPEGSNTMPVYLRVENPAEFFSYEEFSETRDDFESLKAFKEDLLKKGHDGIVIRNSDTDGNIDRDDWIVFDPTSVKSAIGNNGEFDPTNPDIRKSTDREISPLGFYSALADGIANVQSREMGAAGWKQALKAMLNKGQVKQDEIDWSGINEFLDLQQGKISKDAVLEYLRGNGVQVEETVLGFIKPPARFNNPSDAIQFIADELDKTDIEVRDYYGFNNDEDYVAVANKMAAGDGDDDVESDVRYGDYGPPGGENYREVLLRLPADPASKVDYRQREDGNWVVFGPEGDIKTVRTEEEARRLASDRQGDASLRAQKFISSHWSQPNVLAHIRVDDRTDADGKRVLFIREIQSDWGQAGEKGRRAEIKRLMSTGLSKEEAQKRVPADFGFYDPNLEARVREQMDAARQAHQDFLAEMKAKYGGEGLQYARQMTAEEKEEARRLGNEPERIRQESGLDRGAPPKAPFVGKTDAWVGLALKRAIVMAAQEGYDKVALINGEQAADMFDLRKSLDMFGWVTRPNGEKFVSALIRGGSPVQMVVDQSGKITSSRNALANAEGRMLDEVVGKDLADRVMNGPDDTLEGEGLKVGGDGMRAFYDNIVPKVAKDVVKKLGGQLSDVSIATSELTPVEREMNRMRAERGDPLLKQRVSTQTGFEITPEMREKVEAGVPLFSRDRQTETREFRAWFGDSQARVPMTSSKQKFADQPPLVMYHTTRNGDFNAFEIGRTTINSTTFGDVETSRAAIFFTPSVEDSNAYGQLSDGRTVQGANTIPVYLKAENPLYLTEGIDEEDAQRLMNAGMSSRFVYNFLGNWEMFDDEGGRALVETLRQAGYDSVVFNDVNPITGDSFESWAVFEPTQIKSAIGNSGAFDPTNPDITKSADRPWFDDLEKFKVTANYQLGDLLKTSKKLSWWDRTVGTQYNLAQKHPQFRRVFDAVQRFINDVSAFATRAADMAPSILPKLETLKDITRSPLSAEDVKALRDPVFGGTLNYTRNDAGEIIETDDVQAAGVVFTDAELRERFGLNDRQIGLYREFRRATDQSIADLAISDMLRYAGKDAEDVREEVMAAGNVDLALAVLSRHLEEVGNVTPERAAVMRSTIEALEEKADQANNLMDRGYAPLSRFGQYTVYVTGQGGEQIYFSMFENERDANKMAREMREQYPNATVTTGTMSEESYKLFSGVTPETLALFGDALGLEESGIDTKSEAFQAMLKVAKTNRSAMKRLIQRKGIDGFSEDAGRVLAGFVYSNARQIATNLHAGEIGRAASEVKDGDLKDAAIRLMQYIQNPQEEAQAIRGLLFTQFIGGSVASAMVNMTQPFTMTLPYLSQFAGVAGAGKLMTDAVKLASRGIRNDADLQEALKRAEDEGVVSPQEVHQLMAQARGKGALQSGDGTRIGDAAAKANNFVAKLGLGWGKLFGAAEQFNRRVTFIAAYKLAREQGMDNPFEFAEQAIAETQGVYNKGNKPVWARGAVGGTLFTFKQYSIAYVEFLRRMWGNGPEGKKAVGLALAVLFLSAGLGGMPGADDLDDVIDGFAQRVLGKSFDSKQAKKEFFASILGQTGAEFVMGGLTGLPGAPIDLSGRLGLGNLIPGTGILTKKSDYGRDVSEVFGPAGTLFANIATAAGSVAQGEVGKAAQAVAPVAIQNVIKGVDMATMGMYRDQKGRKVIDTEGWEAAVKAIGFQPTSVKRVQDATSTQQGLIAQNKLRETEIADKWAAGRIERNPDKVREAQEELAEWNRKNPDSPIRIDAGQINKRVQQAMMEKARRLEKTAPKEIRATVKQELERAN